MSTIIKATFVDGVLKPEERLDLVDGTKVRLTLDTWADVQKQAVMACAELDQVCEDFPIHSQGRRLTRDELHKRRSYERIDQSMYVLRWVISP